MPAAIVTLAKKDEHDAVIDYINSKVGEPQMSSHVFMYELRDRFNPEQDLACLDYFYSISQFNKKHEFLVKYEKLYEYGITQDTDQSNIKKRLAFANLVKDVHYQVVETKMNTLRGERTKHSYVLTPHGFHMCLITARWKAKDDGSFSPQDYSNLMQFIIAVNSYYDQYQNAIKEYELNQMKQVIVEKDQVIIEKDQDIYTRDQEIVEKEQVIVEKDQSLNEKDQIIVQKETDLNTEKQNSAILVQQVNKLTQMLRDIGGDAKLLVDLGKQQQQNITDLTTLNTEIRDQNTELKKTTTELKAQNTELKKTTTEILNVVQRNQDHLVEIGARVAPLPLEESRAPGIAIVYMMDYDKQTMTKVTTARFIKGRCSYVVDEMRKLMQAKYAVNGNRKILTAHKLGMPLMCISDPVVLIDRVKNNIIKLQVNRINDEYYNNNKETIAKIHETNRLISATKKKIKSVKDKIARRVAKANPNQTELHQLNQELEQNTELLSEHVSIRDDLNKSLIPKREPPVTFKQLKFIHLENPLMSIIEVLNAFTSEMISTRCGQLFKSENEMFNEMNEANTNSIISRFENEYCDSARIFLNGIDDNCSKIMDQLYNQMSGYTLEEAENAKVKCRRVMNPEGLLD